MATTKNLRILSSLLGKISNLPAIPQYGGQSIAVRASSHKHYSPKWKWHRGQKVIKVELPDFHENVDELTPEQMRSRMKERGYLPPRFWNERPFFISSTNGTFEAYVPPEGDGKVSFVTKEGAKQKYNLLEKKSKSMLSIRKIRSYEDEFEIEEFLPQAQDIYIKAHTALSTRDPEELLPYVTERGIPEMLNNVKNKTIKWEFIKSLEPPRIVHARHTDIITKTNLFAQITVRFHTQQMLAVYDRFGRLMYGSDILAKDVLEYIVFEKHISNVYGKWRLHDKIIPDWMPKPEPPPVTYRTPPLPTASDVETATSEVVAKDASPSPEISTSHPTPAIAS